MRWTLNMITQLATKTQIALIWFTFITETARLGTSPSEAVCFVWLYYNVIYFIIHIVEDQ